MIVTVRTPLRVSLFGGGTDYPAYFQREPGAVLGFTINKYIFLSALPLTSAVDYRFRIGYSKVENVDTIDAIEHPVFRAVMRYYGFDSPTDFSAQAHLPAAVGLGTSSAFTVSVINLISHLMGTPRTRMELAREAIYVEQVLLEENVGIQDQLHVSFGGINRFDFHKDDVHIHPINISGADLSEFSSWMCLVYTGIKRRATAMVAEQIRGTRAGNFDTELREMRGFVDAAQELLECRNGRDAIPKRIGELLTQSWKLKRRLSPNTIVDLDDLYDLCMSNGAIGGKLCGAGGGGFLLMLVPPERRRAFEQAVGERRCVKFEIDLQGTVVTSAPFNPLLRAM